MTVVQHAQTIASHAPAVHAAVHGHSGHHALGHHARRLLHHHHQHHRFRFLHNVRRSPFDYAGLALGSLASWVGVPGPGEPLLVAAGLLASKGKLDLATMLVIAWAAATIGGIAGWLIGLKAGRALVTFPGPFRAQRLHALDRGEQVFARYAPLAVVLTPSWIAGINGVRAAVYLPMNALAAALWAGGIGLGAYFAGPTVLELVDDVGTIGLVVAATLIVAAVIAERRRRRRRRGAMGSPTAESRPTTPDSAPAPDGRDPTG